MQPIIQARVDEWISVCKRYADEGKIIDWGLWSQSLAYDVISDLSFGKPLGFVKTETDVDGLLLAFQLSFPLSGMIARLP